MRRLRERILALGGIQAANSYVKVNLSLFDLYPREYCPSIPPESRAAAVQPALPDVVVDARHRDFARDRARRQSAAPVPAGFNLDELWLPGVSPRFPRRRQAGSPGATFFLTSTSSEVVGAVRLQAHPPQGRAQKAEHWMLERMKHSDGLGAIYPPMMYSVMALDVLGYRQGPSAARGSAAPVRQPDGGRRRPLLLPALLLAGVGYGDRGVCAGRSRAASSSPL